MFSKAALMHYTVNFLNVLRSVQSWGSTILQCSFAFVTIFSPTNRYCVTRALTGMRPSKSRHWTCTSCQESHPLYSFIVQIFHFWDVPCQDLQYSPTNVKWFAHLCPDKPVFQRSNNELEHRQRDRRRNLRTWAKVLHFSDIHCVTPSKLNNDHKAFLIFTWFIWTHVPPTMPWKLYKTT